eukprot:2266775-Rhodomonas_salina.1
MPDADKACCATTAYGAVGMRTATTAIPTARATPKAVLEFDFAFEGGKEATHSSFVRQQVEASGLASLVADELILDTPANQPSTLCQHNLHQKSFWIVVH